MAEGQLEKIAPLIDNMGFINATKNNVALKYRPFHDLLPLRISQMLWVNTYNTPSFTLLHLNSKLMACFVHFGHGLLTVCTQRLSSSFTLNASQMVRNTNLLQL